MLLELQVNEFLMVYWRPVDVLNYPCCSACRLHISDACMFGLLL